MAVDALDTLPKLLKHNHETYGDKKVAMRAKQFSIWQEYTWKDYYEKVKYFSLGLISLGLERGDKVSILGENKPQAYWAEVAAQAAGGVAIGIFTDCMANEVQYFAGHSDSKFVVVGDQEQVDKLLEIKRRLFDTLRRTVDRILRFKDELTQEQMAKLLQIKNELDEEQVPEVRRIVGDILELKDKVDQAQVDALRQIVAGLLEIKDKMEKEEVAKVLQIESDLDHGQGAKLFQIVNELLQFKNKLGKAQADALDQIQEEVLVFLLRNDLPIFRKVIYWDPKGVSNYDDPILTSFTRVVEMGQEYDRTHPGLLETSIERGSGRDIAVLCYTSGTTGLPKAAMLSHLTLIETEGAIANVDSYRDGEEIVSFVPLAWVTDQYLGITGPLLRRIIVNFPEKPETVQENIREIGAQLLFWGPRNWESVNRLIQAKMIDTTAFKRFLYHLFLPVGYRVADSRMARGKDSNLLWRILYFVGHWVVFRNLRDKVGLARVRVAITAAAPISPDVIRFFRATGVNIKQVYGGSEQGLVTATRDDDIRPETTGPPTPHAEIRLSDEGEILIRGNSMFSGYYKSPEATEDKVRDGWYYSGDFGHISDDGHLIVMDRMSDLKELSGGQKFSPQYAEIRLRFSPYIKDVLAIGGGDKAYVTCIVNIDMDNVGRWAEARRIPYTTFTDLSQRPEVIGLIRKDIERINKNMPEWARMKKFTNLHREFDADEAELTRTRKIKRTFVEERYHELIEALYSGASELTVEASITYRDGRTGTIKTAIKVNSTDDTVI